MKFLKSCAAILLAPVVAAAVFTYAVFLYDFAARSFLTYWSFWLGLLIYPVFQRFVVRPNGIYIFEHEMTHALFAVFTGSRVKKISLKKDNGSVVVDKTNSLITLAPYFFPLYAASVFALWKIVARIWPQVMPWEPAAHFAFALALSFHFFMTTNAIFHGQSDIRADGVFFSMAVIFFLYVCVSAFLLKFFFGSSAELQNLGGFFLKIWNLSAFFYAWLWRFAVDKAFPAARRMMNAPAS